MSTIAFDVDLLRLHAWSDTVGRVCYNATEWPWHAILEHDTVLVEIGSPVATGRDPVEAYNRRKWAIGNAMQIGRLMHWCGQHSCLDKVLVSPAERWTLGHGEGMRNVVADAVGQDNHDLRACRAMLVYHSTNPDKWQPILAYYRGLSHSKKPKTKTPSRQRSRAAPPDLLIGSCT
jgi:hypothetical protein